MSKNEVLSKNYDVSRRIWNGNVCGNCNISHRCPSRMAGCSGAFAVAVFQYGNKAIWECEVGVKVRIHVASSFTCPYLVAMILHSGMDLCYGFSFFAFFFLISFKGTSLELRRHCSVVFFVRAKKLKSENLNRFTCKKSEDVLHCSEYRIKTSLPNLDSRRLLWDYIYSF